MRKVCVTRKRQHDLPYNCIIVHVLVSIMYHVFARCYHWGKLGTTYTIAFCIISYNSMQIYNYV
jgi:hypothetical protein